MTDFRRADELIENARYDSESEIAFILKRPAGRLRDVAYGVHSHTEKMAMHLNVSPHGNISLEVGNPNTVIFNGQVEQWSEFEPVRWAESEGLAIVQTELGRDHISKNLPASEIMRHFIEAVSVERKACCLGGWKHWRGQIQHVVNAIGRKQKKAVEVAIAMPRTTCPGMEMTKPWRAPNVEYHAVLEDETYAFSPSDEFVIAINDINAKCLPRASRLRLAPPFMVRTQYTEIFTSE